MGTGLVALKSRFFPLKGDFSLIGLGPLEKQTVTKVIAL